MNDVKSKNKSVDLNDYNQFFVPIEGFEVLEKRSKFVVYKLKVENLTNGQFWFIYRRFTDFQRLYNSLRKKFTVLNIKFPSKKWFEDSFNPIFIEKRQLDLQLFLNNLMSQKNLLNDNLIRKFFCIDEPIDSSFDESIYSESCNQSLQSLNCNSCFLMEKKLDEMQKLLIIKEKKIKKLEEDLKVLSP